MANFSYTVVDKAQNRSQGLLNAGDLEAAIKQLENEGNTIISLKAASPEKKSRETLSAKIEIKIKRLFRGVPQDSLIFFTRQLSTMVDAGMTLERALYMLSKDEKHPRFKKITTQCSNDLKKGMALSDVLAKHPEAFDKLYIGLVRAGEQGGMLPKILNDLADYQEKSHDTIMKVKSALYYPVFVLLFLVVCVIVLVFKIAPMFNNIYKNFGADLPLPTRILMNVSDVFIQNSLAGILVTLMLAFLLFAFSLSDRGSLLFDSFKLRLPIFGKLIKDSLFARFSRTLSLLTGSGVAMQDALRLSGSTMTNKVLANAVALIEKGVKQGRSISHVMGETNTFPSLMTGIVATGEETGELDSLLIKSAQFFEKQVEALISRITSLIEPILIMLLGIVVGTIVIIIYLPIFYLGIAIKQGMH